LKRKQQDFRKEKYLRYSIRKYSFGAASVAIAAGLMFLGNGAVSATEVQGSDTTVTVTKSPATPAPTDKLESDLATVRSEVVTPPTTVLAEKPESLSTAVKPEVATPATAEKEDKIVEAKKADKTALTKKVVELEAKVASAKKADATAIATANEV